MTTSVQPMRGSIDRTLIRQALRQTPRQRFEAGLELYRVALRFRSARRVSPPRKPTLPRN